jgi:hypothetical protein
VIVVLDKRRKRGLFKAVFVPALSTILVLGTFTFAFGDFVPVSTLKVLGVGRIQSAPAATPVATEQKFALATHTEPSVAAEQSAELVAPIAREVAQVVVEPDPTPPPPPPVNNTPSHSPSVGEDGWIITLATNYGTPGDGFLGRPTASGALTTTTSMGVAHKSLPLGTQIELYVPKTGLSCIAVVNDRGPYDGRPDTFDFQMGVTEALGNNFGWYTVHYRILS